MVTPLRKLFSSLPPQKVRQLLESFGVLNRHRRFHFPGHDLLFLDTRLKYSQTLDFSESLTPCLVSGKASGLS